ncbi:MAG: hypothetical protein KF838_10435 [Phycisphaeraceae bacterium]|nr:MAG: hypothetical protein KF838_10435 [Phycisphaeraceae bacterium]
MKPHADPTRPIVRRNPRPGRKMLRETIAAIDSEVSRFGTGSPQGDDMTMVVLRRV